MTRRGRSNAAPLFYAIVQLMNAPESRSLNGPVPFFGGRREAVEEGFDDGELLVLGGERDVRVGAYEIQSSFCKTGSCGVGAPWKRGHAHTGVDGVGHEVRRRGAVNVDLPVERRKRGVVVGACDPRQPVAAAHSACAALSKRAVAVVDSSLRKRAKREPPKNRDARHAG